jgi:hypothetical protein
MFRARGGWASCKARASPPAQTFEGNVMKTLIRVVKRGSEDIKHNSPAAVQAKPRLTTETIVKSWIIESRERRRAVMSELHNSIGWKELEGLSRG